LLKASWSEIAPGNLTGCAGAVLVICCPCRIGWGRFHVIIAWFDQMSARILRILSKARYYEWIFSKSITYYLGMSTENTDTIPAENCLEPWRRQIVVFVDKILQLRKLFFCYSSELSSSVAETTQTSPDLFMCSLVIKSHDGFL
jgi:hypothetical protein